MRIVCAFLVVVFIDSSSRRTVPVLGRQTTDFTPRLVLGTREKSKSGRGSGGREGEVKAKRSRDSEKATERNKCSGTRRAIDADPKCLRLSRLSNDDERLPSKNKCERDESEKKARVSGDRRLYVLLVLWT